MEIVKFVEPEDVLIESEQIDRYRERESKDRYLNKNRLWEEQAIRMLARQNYDEAIKCFQRAGNVNNVKRVQAIKIEKDTEI